MPEGRHNSKLCQSAPEVEAVSCEELRQSVHRKPDYGVRRAIDPRNQQAAEALDGVCAGLVHRFAGSDVPTDLLVFQINELYPRRISRLVNHTVGGEYDGGMNHVRSARKSPEHLCSIGGRCRFAEYFRIDLDHGVGTEHQMPGTPCRDIQGLVPGGAGGVGEGFFPRGGCFFGFRGHDGELHPQDLEELAAARRLDIAFTTRLNTWKGETSVQLVLSDAVAQS